MTRTHRPTVGQTPDSIAHHHFIRRVLTPTCVACEGHGTIDDAGHPCPVCQGDLIWHAPDAGRTRNPAH